ncbi:hypothetical protein N8873_03095 [Flavobacteriaceae bacterium]|nr:hypothetical protein [Flavobacteriaceae bacterium]
MAGTLATGVTTTTIYYYTLTTTGSGCGTGVGTISGTITVYPLEQVSTDLASETTICESEYVELDFDFVSVPYITLTASSSLPVGLNSSISYTTTPSVELTVVTSGTAINQVYRVERVLQNGTTKPFSYKTTSATESITYIAEQLAALIDADATLTASATAGVITVESTDLSYVFWMRVNSENVGGTIAYVSDAKIQVTDAIPVTGVFTISGTPTIDISETASYSLTLETPGFSTCDTTSETIVLYINPGHSIDLSSAANTLNQTICDNTSITSITFDLSGGATGYTGLVWVGATPGGTLAASVDASNTITLSGAVSTDVTTTTVYIYSLTTTGNDCGTSATVTGSITVLPNHYIDLAAGSGALEQTVCDLGALDPITFDLSGGATGYTLSWTSGQPPGLAVYESSSSSTTFTISGTIDTSVITTTSYGYTITTNGNACDQLAASLTGTITVIPQLVIVVDTPVSQNQIGTNAICNGEDIVDIEFSFSSGTPTRIVDSWTDIDGNSIASPGPTLDEVNYVLEGSISTEATTLTTYYYTITATSDDGTCVFTDSFSGSIQVTPGVVVDADYINENDIIHVSCEGADDASISIPITPESEFEKRISGGVLATTQIDKVTLSVSATLQMGDQISVIIDGITFTSIVPAAATTQTIFEELRDKVNFGTGADSIAVTASVVDTGTVVYLQLVADTAGTGFTASGTTVTSSVTGTTVVETEVENEALNYQYSWTGPNGFVSSDLSISNLEAGTYYLEVQVNDCPAVPTTYEFVIEEPSISLGTVSQTCDGDITVPIDAYYTPSQLDVAGNKLTLELYELDAVSNLYVPSDSYSPLYFGSGSLTASHTYAANFAGLEESQAYKLVLSSATCSTTVDEVLFTIDTFLTINEGLITTTDEECFGSGGTLTVGTNAITGGSGYYSYQWTNLTSGDTYITKNVTNADAGLYELTVTDQNYDCEETTTGLIEIKAVEPVVNVVFSQPGPFSNDCYDSRDGTLEVVVTGGTGDFFYEWYFIPQTSSVTLQLVNDDPILIVDNVIPASYYAGGEYYVKVYDGGGILDCAVGWTTTNFKIINPEEISFATASNTITDILCAGEETGSFYMEVNGGSNSYLYTINGGVPYIASSGVISENQLAAGNYTLIVEDANNACSTAQQITLDFTISEPAGGALEITENTVNEIPCSGGLGSIVVNISGGSPLTTNSASSVIDFYTVTVTRQRGGFTLNTSHDPSDTTLTIGNLTTAGTYDIKVTDTNGCSQELNNIILNISSNGLGATADLTLGGGCNSISSGASIIVDWLDKGDGNIAGYPLWQKRISKTLDSFKISLNGTVANVDPSAVGLAITTTISQSLYASDSSSTTIESIQDVAALLTYELNLLSDVTATLDGTTITVKGEVIEAVSALGISSSTLKISVSNISQVSESIWQDIPGLAGQEIVSDLGLGYYRAIINDSSGCGGTLVQNSTQGGTIFKVYNSEIFEFKNVEVGEISCNNSETSFQFQLSNGLETLAESSNISLTLNSSQGSVPLVKGTSYEFNPITKKYTIYQLTEDSYSLQVESSSTSSPVTICTLLYDFTIEPDEPISYDGPTEFVISSCYETYQDGDFWDNLNLTGGTPYYPSSGAERFYQTTWTYYADDQSQNTSTINSISSNINFNPSPGFYEVMVYDANGCTITDSAGNTLPIEFTFTKQLGNLEVIGTGGASGNDFSQPVSCEINAEDGQINIEVVSSDPLEPVPPFEIIWEIQQSSDVAFEQRLLFQGVTAAEDSLEVYTIKLNDIPISYTTLENSEPILSVVNEFTNIIDDKDQFIATVDVASNPYEIIIRTSSQAALDLEIVSENTQLQMVNSSSNSAVWIALDGTNGTTNYTGYSDLNNLSEGLYRYTITAVDVTDCDNSTEPQNYQGIITVENENILEIREGPIVDEYLCNGQPGTMFVDVFDGNTGPLTFFYNNTPVTYEIVGTDQYIINIDSPVEIATLEIYNAANCGISREINIGNGTPLFDFTSTNYEQAGTFLAREDVTFRDNSENEYDTFEFIFGDGTQTELIERNSPEPIIHEYAISGTYYVTLRIYNDLGCMEELTQTIKIGKGYSILTPNVFTPNGDEWNDTFRPVFNGLSEIVLRIYDAHGGLLHEEVGEDGKNPESVGVGLEGWPGPKTPIITPYYIYTVTGKTIDDEEVFKDGTFILLQ